MRSIIFASLFCLISTVSLGKEKYKYPAAKGQFLTKNVWRGKTKVSFVRFYCFMNECTWKEVEIDQCLMSTTQLYLNFFPFVYFYSTSGDGHLADKMTVKSISKDVFSVTLDAGQNTKADYVVSLDCPSTGQLAEPGCKVKSVTGSMIDVNSERTTYDLIDAKNLKDLKLDRCQ
jgi:hypothetical protein